MNIILTHKQDFTEYQNRWEAHVYLGQVLLDDITPHLGGIQLGVEASADHRHDVIYAAQSGLVGQQVPTQHGG